MCAIMGRVTPATVADHRTPHRGDPALFFDPGNLASLCKIHQDATKRRIERGGKRQVAVDANGWPIE
jgi:hypothetical protein